MKLLYTLIILLAFSFSTFAYGDEISWDEDKIISTGYTKSGEYVVNKETYKRAIKDCEYLGILNNKIYYKKKKRIGELSALSLLQFYQIFQLTFRLIAMNLHCQIIFI